MYGRRLLHGRYIQTHVSSVVNCITMPIFAQTLFLCACEILLALTRWAGLKALGALCVCSAENVFVLWNRSMRVSVTERCHKGFSDLIAFAVQAAGLGKD